MNVDSLTVNLLVVLGGLGGLATFVATGAWHTSKLNARVNALEKETNMLKEALNEIRRGNENILVVVAELKHLREGQIEIRDNLRAVEQRLNRIVDCSYTAEDTK